MISCIITLDLLIAKQEICLLRSKVETLEKNYSYLLTLLQHCSSKPLPHQVASQTPNTNIDNFSKKAATPKRSQPLVHADRVLEKYPKLSHLTHVEQLSVKLA